ncbi:hypothetical protein DV515_00018794, partial [Chloebia gouldiae]
TFGKLGNQRESQQPREDTNSSSVSTSVPQPATAGSLGMDLAAAVEVNIMTTSPIKIQTGVKGPIMINGQTVGGLLLGRSSAFMMGLFVLLGVIDADYTGEIMIMAHTPFPPIRIQQGQRIAQLVPLPQLSKGIVPAHDVKRGKGGFGSTGGIALLTLDLSTRPKKTVELRYREQKCTLTALLDTGADSSIISPQSWPQGWPVQASTSTITGVGGMTLASKSPLLTVVIGNRRLNAVFSIVQLPPTVQCLVGRDILTQLGIVLTNEQPFTELQIQQIQNELHKHHLVIAPEKIQHTTPWKYLGWTLTEQIITPQKLNCHTEITTLQDAQKLLGDLQWLRPVVGIPNELLEALRPLLKGTDPAQPVTLTVSQQKILQQITDCVTQGQLRQRSPDLPIDFSVWLGSQYLIGALTQQLKKTGEHWVLEWISPPLQQQKTLLQKIEVLSALIKKGRKRTLQVTGEEPSVIYLPIQKDSLQWYLSQSEELQEALLGATSTIVTTNKTMAPLQWMGTQNWMVKPKREKGPIPNATTVYTDAGKKSRIAAVTWQEKDVWNYKILQAASSDTLQTLELLAVVRAMLNFKGPLNVVTDSLYVAGVVERIEDAAMRQVQSGSLPVGPNQRLGRKLNLQ